MIVIKNQAWRVMLALLLVAGLSIAVSGVALYKLSQAGSERDRLITALQKQAADGAVADAGQRRREAAFLLLVQGLQAQVRRLGGTPLPVPAVLQSAPPSSRSTSTLSPSPRPTAGPVPQPSSSRPSPTAHPSSSASPTPTSSPVVCVRVPSIVIGC